MQEFLDEGCIGYNKSDALSSNNFESNSFSAGSPNFSDEIQDINWPTLQASLQQTRRKLSKSKHATAVRPLASRSNESDREFAYRAGYKFSDFLGHHTVKQFFKEDDYHLCRWGAHYSKYYFNGRHHSSRMCRSYRNASASQSRGRRNAIPRDYANSRLLLGRVHLGPLPG